MTQQVWPTSSASSEAAGRIPAAGASLVPAAEPAEPECTACGEECEDGESYCTRCLHFLEPDEDRAYDEWRERKMFGDDW